MGEADLETDHIGVAGKAGGGSKELRLMGEGEVREEVLEESWA